MNSSTTARNADRSALLSYLSLFTSLSTLLCCALPSLLVLFGLGASVASLLSFTPWLVVLSRHKSWTFSISGVLIAASFVSMYHIVPRLMPSEKCDADDRTACRNASRTSKVLLWVSAAIYASGFFAAYVLGPILTKLDR
jgi:mercuric ion transport protein